MTPQSERKGLVERLQQFARWVIEETVFEEGSGSVDGADVQAEAEKLGLLTETEYDPEVHGESDIVEPGDSWFVFSDLLSSDARPAPMLEEVKDALDHVRLVAAQPIKFLNHLDLSADTLSAHIDDLTRKVAQLERDQYAIASNANRLNDEKNALTRKVAEAETRRNVALASEADLIGRLTDASRPQQTDAVLAETPDLEVIEAAYKDALLAPPTLSLTDAHYRGLQAVYALARPSTSPATETERKDGWWVTPKWEEVTRDSWHLSVGGALAGYVRRYETGWAATKLDSGVVVTNLPTRAEAQAALLSSVRPKAEGV